MTERNSLEANAECVLCTPVQTHGAGNSQGEIKCERRAQSSQSWRRGAEEARRFLSLKLSCLDFFFPKGKKKRAKNPNQKNHNTKPSTSLGLNNLTEVPLALPDHLTAGFEGPRLT